MEFGIPRLHRLILLAFPMLILQVVELIEKAPLVHVIFLDLLLFVGLLINNLLLHNRLQRLSMKLLLPNSLDSAYHERL
jgi:hypothetical protein